jgi:predicted TIM-barrel fold metal-dependent hydrolase
MNIIDCQVHVWPAERPDRLFLRDGQGRESAPYPYEQLLADMAAAGVDRAVLVPPSIEGDRNDYALEAARRHPDRFAVMGRFPLINGQGRDLLAGWKKAGMLGVRLTFHRDADRPWLTDGTADWFWPEAERHAIPVMVHAPERLAEIGNIAARHPGLKLIVDHMGFARATMDDKTIAAAERVAALARHPNIYVKVSALPAFSTEPYPFRNLREPLRRVISAFGPRRCFWGSDITRVPKSRTYRQVVTHFTEELDFLSAEDLDWIMGRGLAECLGWHAAQQHAARR